MSRYPNHPGYQPSSEPPPKPSTRAALVREYGDPGQDREDPRFRRTQITTCHGQGLCPPLPGVNPRRWVSVHRRVEPMLRLALERAVEAVPALMLERCGGYVWRHQRHDQQRPLSLHAWGVAVDLEPANNTAMRHHAGNPYAEPWTPRWCGRWPLGIQREVVEAFESVGWVWGGRWTDFCDPMHFQWYDQ